MNTQEKQMDIDSLKDYEKRLIELADQIWEVAEPVSLCSPFYKP